MAGKWGIGGVGPQGEGFEHAFYLDPEADYASNFAPPANYMPGVATNPPYPMYEPHFEDGKEVSLPEDYFSTHGYADTLMPRSAARRRGERGGRKGKTRWY